MEKTKVVYHSEVSNEGSKSSVTMYDSGNIEFKVEESQLNRIENKVDRILELLENKDLSTFSETHGVSNEKLAQLIYGAIE